jgi:citrate synthase
LFEITADKLNTGLRGFPVGTCRTSAVDPELGVTYVGYPIEDLAHREPEEMVYLLVHRALPTPEELSAFKANLAARRGVDPKVMAFLKGMPKEGHPMEWLIAGLVLLGMTSKTGSWSEDALNLIARSPELIAGIFRVREGWGEPIPSDPSLSLIDDFVHMLGVPGGDPARLSKMLSVFYVLHLDHGGGNLSTFVGKAVASSHADVYASMAAAMAGLYGPLHGRANQDCLALVQRVPSDDPAEVEAFVRAELARGEKIYGFGHAVLRAEDPRARIQYALGAELCPDDPLFKVAVVLRKVAVGVLSSIDKVSNPYPNVDAVSGTLLNAHGLTDPEYYTVLFGLARIVGIAAQIVEERVAFRGGKGVPIYRPKFVAESQPPRRLQS